MPAQRGSDRRSHGRRVAAIIQLKLCFGHERAPIIHTAMLRHARLLVGARHEL